MNFDITLQIFSGGFSGKAVSYKQVEHKLISILPRLPVRAVIMGWSRDKKLYEKTAEFLTKRNIDFYLWFPVFSETGALKGLSPLVDFEGRQIINRGKHEEEDFSFCCPNSSENIEKILEIFEREFASIKFNGIFLDKIRYPSFANGNGQRTVFSCFCPHCRETYEKEQLDVELLKKALVCPTGLGGQTPMGISSYRGCGEYVFDNPVLSRFFEVKAGIIFKSLERICGYFRDRNYGIGLDVFAPFLSPFVGQDLTALSELCDFIKPMMYRATQAPAGMPFETEALLRETNANDAARQGFYDLLGLNPKENPFDLSFAVKDLQSITALSACPVYAGLEINRKEQIAEVYPGYIKETIEAYARTGIRGFALSWNLLDTPEENILSTINVISV